MCSSTCCSDFSSFLGKVSARAQQPLRFSAGCCFCCSSLITLLSLLLTILVIALLRAVVLWHRAMTKLTHGTPRTLIQSAFRIAILFRSHNLEPPGRIELPTSSLPRTRTTDCATEAHFKFGANEGTRTPDVCLTVYGTVAVAAVPRWPY